MSDERYRCPTDDRHLGANLKQETSTLVGMALAGSRANVVSRIHARAGRCPRTRRPNFEAGTSSTTCVRFLPSLGCCERVCAGFGRSWPISAKSLHDFDKTLALFRPSLAEPDHIRLESSPEFGQISAETGRFRPEFRSHPVQIWPRSAKLAEHHIWPAGERTSSNCCVNSRGHVGSRARQCHHKKFGAAAPSTGTSKAFANIQCGVFGKVID